MGFIRWYKEGGGGERASPLIVIMIAVIIMGNTQIFIIPLVSSQIPLVRSSLPVWILSPTQDTDCLAPRWTTSSAGTSSQPHTARGKESYWQAAKNGSFPVS